MRPRACWCPFSFWSSQFWPWEVPGHVHTRSDWPGQDWWDQVGRGQESRVQASLQPSLSSGKLKLM